MKPSIVDKCLLVLRSGRQKNQEFKVILKYQFEGILGYLRPRVKEKAKEKWGRKVEK